MDANGASISYDDDSGVGFNSSLTFTATGSGTYYVNAGGYSDTSTGGYDLQISEGILAF